MVNTCSMSLSALGSVTADIASKSRRQGRSWGCQRSRSGAPRFRASELKPALSSLVYYLRSEHRASLVGGGLRVLTPAGIEPAVALDT
jgi:hypothetical protein